MLLIGLEDDLVWGDDFWYFLVIFIFLLLLLWWWLQILLNLCAIINDFLMSIGYDIFTGLWLVIIFPLFIILLFWCYSFLLSTPNIFLGIFLPLLGTHHLIFAIDDIPIPPRKEPITMDPLWRHFGIVQSIMAWINLWQVYGLLIFKGLGWVLMRLVGKELNFMVGISASWSAGGYVVIFTNTRGFVIL